ncbi:hypothetical protein CRE_15558 [Caenorhabditis remanei]|uniref:Uncharacterized protein n=1 Tax=Caenorhabditis remanei TaxID=31234 RepID=E3MSY3_CAERE|nr:hypothetical protein CRE_15558 [Caenorhabditis remanei]
MIGQQMVNAFVVSRDDSTETFYAYCNSIGRDLIIDKHFVPPDVDILGKWIKVLVCHENKVCQNVLVIDDLYECRVMQGLPEIKVDIEHVSRFEDKFEMFHHNFFGFICDVRNVIKVVEHAVSYNVWIVRHREPGTNSRWRVSVKQDNVVSINFHNHQPDLRVVEGVIHSHNAEGVGYTAWSKSEPTHRIFINYSLCPSEEDLLGLWFKIQLDDKSDAQSLVSRIDSPFPTRVKSNVVEILVQFECVPNASDRAEALHHSYFGYICDPKNVLPGPETGETYSGWIAYHHKADTSSRWRLATQQTINGPLFRDQRPEVRSSNNENFQYRSRSSLSHRRSPSPTIINEYDETDDTVNGQLMSSPYTNAKEHKSPINSTKGYERHIPNSHHSSHSPSTAPNINNSRQINNHFPRDSSPQLNIPVNRPIEYSQRNQTMNHRSPSNQSFRGETTDDSEYYEDSDEEFKDLAPYGRFEGLENTMTEEDRCSPLPQKSREISTTKNQKYGYNDDHQSTSTYMAVNQYGDSNHIPDQNAHQTETKNQKTSEKREILRLKLVIYFFKSLYELVRSWVLLNGYYSKTPESYIFLN